MVDIKDVVKKYKYDNLIKFYAYKYYKREYNVIHSSINSKEDVEDARSTVEYYIELYENKYPLHREDPIDIEKALGKYEIAVGKLIQCYPHMNFYTGDELQQMVDNIPIYEQQIKKIATRYCMQD